MKERDIKTFFLINAPQSPGVTVRAVNALIRGGIETMDELCGKSESELRMVRNMGEKCLALTIAMRERYMNENSIHREEIK